MQNELLAFSLVNGINQSLARLVDIWDSIGIQEAMRVERMEAVKKGKFKSRIEKNIITYRKELDTLYHELLTVLQLEKDLRIRVESLMKEKNDRLKELKSLQEEDKSLCIDLCATPYYIPTGSVPTRQQLLELQEHIKNLSVERVLCSLAYYLKWEVLYFQELFRIISLLPSSYVKIKFAKSFLWQLELERLEELKRANMQEVIENIRKELLEFWDKCTFSTEQRESFAAFSDGNFTEELLVKHEDELSRLKSYYEKCKSVFEAVERWEQNWRLFQDFERKASDPSRFSNRGGSLLKESKERTKVQKMLPKLEEEIKSFIDTWEAEQGTVFLVRGQRFMDYVAKQWEDYKLQKEKEKNERVSLKFRILSTILLRAPRHPLPTPSTPSAEEDNDAPAEDTAPACHAWVTDLHRETGGCRKKRTLFKALQTNICLFSKV
uniref:Zgc:86764 n=1 Tax=Erpetoichthys calabaricus TaxID=27687 RepID=A0A8C4RGM9_ERPCA